MLIRISVYFVAAYYLQGLWLLVKVVCFLFLMLFWNNLRYVKLQKEKVLAQGLIVYLTKVQGVKPNKHLYNTINSSTDLIQWPISQISIQGSHIAFSCHVVKFPPIWKLFSLFFVFHNLFMFEKKWPTMANYFAEFLTIWICLMFLDD